MRCACARWGSGSGRWTNASDLWVSLQASGWKHSPGYLESVRQHMLLRAAWRRQRVIGRIDRGAESMCNIPIFPVLPVAIGGFDRQAHVGWMAVKTDGLCIEPILDLDRIGGLLPLRERDP